MDTKPQYGLVVSLIIVALLGVGLYFFISAILDKLNALNSDLGKAIIAGAVTVAAAIVTLVVGKVWEQKVKIQQEIREKKIPVYEKQIETFFAVMFAEKITGQATSQEDIQKAFLIFTEKLIIWGSPDVIRAWSSFRLHDVKNSKPTEHLLKLEMFIRAIRTDLGSSNATLPTGELMRLFVNDFPKG